MKRWELILLCAAFEITMFTAGYAFSVSSQIPVSINVLWAPNEFRFDWADFDNNGTVNIVDIATAAVCFDKTVSSPDWSQCAYWDFNLNNRIDIVDIAVAASQFGRIEAPPFPGQSQPPLKMDPKWPSECSLLDPSDQPYCKALPP